MAKTPKKALDLVSEIMRSTNPYAKAEAQELQRIANNLGHGITIEP